MVLLPAFLGAPFHLWTGHGQMDSDLGMKVGADRGGSAGANENTQLHMVSVQQYHPSGAKEHVRHTALRSVVKSIWSSVVQSSHQIRT